MGKEVQMGAQNININPDDLEDVCCDKCGSQFFQPTFLFKHLSAVLSPTGQSTMIPLQVYRCQDCGHVNDIFLPKKQDGSSAIDV